MAPTEINVQLVVSSTSDGEWIGTDYPLTLIGDEEEDFYAVVARTFEGVTGRSLAEARGSDQEWVTFAWNDPEFPQNCQLISADATGGLTMGDVAIYFGEEIQAVPATIIIDTEGGRGGDGGVLPELIRLGTDALTYYGLFQAAIEVKRAILRRIHRESRLAIRNWEDSGVISMELQQLVRAERWWSRRDFNSQFGTSNEQGSQLLRELGYERGDTDGSYWWNPNES